MDEIWRDRRGPGIPALLAYAVDVGIVFGTLWTIITLYDGTWDLHYLTAAVIGSLLFLLVGERTGAYDQRQATGALHPVLNAWLIALVVLGVIAWMTKTTAHYSRVAVGLWCVAAPVSMIAWRLGARRLRQLQPRRRVGIVGTDAPAKRAAELVAAAPDLGLEVAGFYESPAPGASPVPSAAANGSSAALQISGDLDQLVRDARANDLDVVYITLPMDRGGTIEGLIDALADTTVSVYLLPDMLIRSLLHSRWVQVGLEPVVSVFESPHLGFAGAAKRIEDLVLGTTILILAALPMVVVAVALKATSPGPVAFRQRRYGIDGREFMVWKFRTMTVAEDGDHVPQARPDDARITPLGAFLRRTSLDELPQLVNVLRGEMSLVGPRPHAVAHNEEYRRLVPGYMRRHKIKPGITGWAQINGWRGPTDTLDKMVGRLQCDLWYLRRWSIWLDLEILLRTPWVVWAKPSEQAF